MKAAVFYAAEDLRIEDVAEPTPGPGQVKLRNAFSGICGSDLHIYYAPEASGVNYAEPHPLTGATLPQILGHEFSGTVVELGEGVDGVKVGDNVAVWPIYYCGECVACEKGAYSICRKATSHGIQSDGGGMAEYTTVSASQLHVLPENIGLRLGALVEPMAVAWHAVDRSRIAAGQSALIAGAGPIGIGLWFALKARGVTNVLVSEPNELRRAALKGLGASVIDPVNEDLAARVAEMTNGNGIDVGFDAAGAAPAVLSVIMNLTPRGRVVIVALHERDMQLNPTMFVLGETEMIGVLGYSPEDYAAIIDAMAKGLYDTTGWVDEVSLDDVNSAIADLRAGKGMTLLVSAHA